jgi:hypothetical protein
MHLPIITTPDEKVEVLPLGGMGWHRRKITYLLLMNVIS